MNKIQIVTKSPTYTELIAATSSLIMALCEMAIATAHFLSNQRVQGIGGILIAIAWLIAANQWWSSGKNRTLCSIVAFCTIIPSIVSLVQG